MEVPINSKRGGSEHKEANAAEIEETLNRTLELIHTERDEWRAFENTIDNLLRPCVERLRLLTGLIRDDDACPLSGLSGSNRDLVLNDALGAEQLLDQVLKRIAQPQIAGKGRAISFQYLRRALALLEVAVKEASISESDSEPSARQALQHRHRTSQLRDQIKQEIHLLDTLESDLRQRPEILEALHTQALFVHRCRSILRRDQEKMLPDLLSIAVQIEETVKGERLESAANPSFWTHRNDKIDEQLCQLEGRLRRRLLPIPSLGWMTRKLARLQRQESTQGRILAGLGVSLSIALGFYVVSTSATFLLGTLAAINKANARMRSVDDYGRLAVQVKRLLDNNNQMLDIEADLEGLNKSIDESVASIKDLQGTPVVSPASSQDGIQSSETRSPGGKEAQEEKSMQSQLNALNRERSQKLRQRALKLDEYNQILNNLSILETRITSSTPLSPSVTGASAAPTGSAAVALSTTDQGQGVTASPSGSLAGGESADLWYVSVVDILASPIQDPAFLRHSRRLALAAFAGALGSIMSILIRLDQMDGKNVKNPFMVGALKPVIGAVFGIVTFMILSTNVIDFMPANFRLHSRPASMPGNPADPATDVITVHDPLGELDSQELYKIFLVAFLAGFSERLASDTLRSVDRK